MVATNNIFEKIDVTYAKDEWHKMTITLCKNSETEYGEPQIWISFSDGTSLEITHETNGLRERDQFISMRHNCNEDDFENEVYKDTNGIISSFVYANVLHLIDGISIFLTNMYKKNITIMEDV